MDNDVPRNLEECLKEIRSLKKDLYGNPQIRQKGVFDRLEALEEKLSDLRATYERESVQRGHFERLEQELDQLRLDYKVAIVYLRGIAAAVATITVTLIGAVIVGIMRFLAQSNGG